MGGAESRDTKVTPADLDSETIEELKMIASFTDTEIMHLLAIFKKLDSDDSGYISFHELRHMPVFTLNPFLPRVLRIFDKNLDQQLSLKEFAQLMSTFSVKAARENKLRFAFSIYDWNNDAKIDIDDLTLSVKCMVKDHLTDEEITQVVDKVFEEVDKDQNNFIAFDEFVTVVANSGIETKLTIEF